MFIARSIKKSGSIIYRFRYRDMSGKLRSVPRVNYSHIDNTNKKAMEKELPIIASKFDVRAKIEREKQEWHKQYYNFTDLYNAYEKARKKSAPRSWDTKASYFRGYVLDFFLNVKREPNLEGWRYHFRDFKDWLDEQDTSRYGKPLAHNTKSQIAGELNYFLGLMTEMNKCDPQPMLRIKRNDLVLTIDDVMLEDEYEPMIKYFKSKHTKKESLFVEIIRHGALRKNECFSISIDCYKPASRLDNKDVLKIIGSHKMFKNVKSFLIIKSQLDQKDFKRLTKKRVTPWGTFEKGELLRKPLKSKPNMSNYYWKYIPIMDASLDKEIKKLAQEQIEKFKKGEHGKKPENYFLFDGVSGSSVYNKFIKAQLECGVESLKGKTKNLHSLRHLRAMEYCLELEGNHNIVQLILGHSDEKMSKRYSHFNESLGRQIEASEFNISDFDI